MINVDKEYSRIQKQYWDFLDVEGEERYPTLPMNPTQEGESLAGMHLELLLSRLIKFLENKGYPKEYIDGVTHARIEIFKYVANRHLGMTLFEELLWEEEE